MICNGIAATNFNRNISESKCKDWCVSTHDIRKSSFVKLSSITRYLKWYRCSVCYFDRYSLPKCLFLVCWQISLSSNTIANIHLKLILKIKKISILSRSSEYIQYKLILSSQFNKSVFIFSSLSSCASRWQQLNN